MEPRAVGTLEQRHEPLSPHVPRIVIHVVLLQERDELFLKTALAMMLRLRADVGDRVGLLRNANCKCAVSLLPGEILDVLVVHPMRGATFD